MLEVSVRLLSPHEHVGREICAVRIVNDGEGDVEYGSYDVYIDDGAADYGDYEVRFARVNGHQRQSGALTLLRKALQEGGY